MKIAALSLMALTVVASLMTTGSSTAVTETTTATAEERGMVPEVRPHRVKYGKKTTQHNLPHAATGVGFDSCLVDGENCNIKDDKCCGACVSTSAIFGFCYG